MDWEHLKIEEKGRAEFLAKWLRVLFYWTLFSGIVSGILESESILAFCYHPELVTTVLAVLEIAGSIFIFAKLGKESSCYHAVILCLVMSLCVRLVLFGQGPKGPLWWGMQLLGVGVAFANTYNTWQGHIEILNGIHSRLADQWKILWKWCVRLLIGIPAGLLIGLIMEDLGAIVALVSLIGLIVVGVLNWVYLWKTVKVFQTYIPKDCPELIKT